MRARTALLVGAVLLASVGLAGAATATHVETDRASNQTSNASGGSGVGICVTGVDSPCNGEQWDGNSSTVVERNTTADEPGGDTDEERDTTADEPRGEVVERNTTANGSSGTPIGRTGESTSESGRMGICVTGVESPCNSAQWELPHDASAPTPLATVVRTLGGML